MSSLALAAMLGLFVLAMAGGVPLAFSMLLSCIVYFVVKGEPLYLVVHQFFTGLDTFTLMAIPFFTLAGDLMVESGTAERMLKFANVVVGRFRGGLGYVTILSSMLFGGCSGSSISEVAGLGPLQVRMMEAGGYQKTFATALMTGASIQGAIIPPSIPMVLVGAVTGTSIGGMLVGGAVPGVLAGLAMAIVVFFKTRGLARGDSGIKSLAGLLAVTVQSLPFLMMPIIILGGILSGVFTPTEASAVAVGYGFVLLVAEQRSRLDWTRVYGLLVRSAALSAAVLMLSGASSVFAWILATEQVPSLIARVLFQVSDNPIIILLIINVFLLLWGMFMDMLPAIFIVVPILMPLVQKLGIDPIHFGVVVTFNLVLGLITPPYGTALFTSAIVTDLPIEAVVRRMMPFFLASLAILMLITYVPETVLFLPRLFGLDQ